MIGGSTGKGRQMDTPLDTDVLAVPARPVARSIYKAYTLPSGKIRLRKTSDVHPVQQNTW